MVMRRSAWGALAVALAAILPITAAPAADGKTPGDGLLQRLLPGATFSPGIPSPENFRGTGDSLRPLRPGELVSYLEALAAASPRAKLVEYARSHEGRPLVYLAVGDEATVAGLDEFRARHARRLDPRGRGTAEDAKALESAKAVAWMAYGIHGDELSSSDAAAVLAYYLVAGEDERARALRRDLLVLVDPCENPDGRERFLAQTTAFAHAGPTPDTEDLSHTTVWPWGRGNHYLFDLNRDWLTLVHPESRRVPVIASWNPQLMVDSHEMGSDDTYLFSPARPPFNPLKPAHLGPWADRFAADQARALDSRGFAYYTREWNEEFFPGYGSSWASYLGAVGILYEMARVSGTLVKQSSGTVRTFAEAVEHQLASSVANLETLAANRAVLLREAVASRRAAVRRGAEGPVRAWLLPPGRYPDRTDHLAELLRAQGIEVHRAAAPVKASGLRDARTGETSSAELPAGTWMVPLDQPAAPLARVILDPHVPMEPAFLREEREYLERGKGTRLYETTAWSLPIAFGVEAFWTGNRPAGDWRAESRPDPRGTVEEAPQAYGYVFEGTTDRSVFALADLLQRHLSVRVAEKPFRIAGTAFDRGAILVKREGNPGDLAGQMEQVARSHGISIRAVPTARSEEGPDLGGNHFRLLVAPRVGVWTGMPVSPSAYGDVWHLLDREAGLRFTGLDLSRFDDTDLARYNVLIFPPAWGEGAYRDRLGKEGVERLKRWIEAGGTAIGIAGGAHFLADRQTDLTKTRLRRQALDRYPPVVFGLGPEEADAAGAFRAAGLREDPAPPAEGARPKPVQAPARRSSPYDVAPLIGPGARPFVEGPQGTPVTGKPIDLAEWLKPFLTPGKERPDSDDLQRGDERLRRFAPRGTFVRIDLDPEVWLDWGMPPDSAAYLDARDTLVAEPPVQVAARFADIERLHLSGLLWPEAAGRLARTAYLTREEVGRGQVILFLDEPGFREWTLATRRLLLNAILYGPGLGARWSSPW